MTSKQRYIPPTCPDCGASLPHDNPMSREYHEQQVQKQRETILLASGKATTKPNVGYLGTNSDETEEYGYINYNGRTIQVKRVGPHTWEEKPE